MPPERENTKHWVNPHFTLPYQDCQFTYPGIPLVRCITVSQREYSAKIKGPRETDALKPSCCCWPHFCQHLPYPDTQLLSSTTCSCRSLLHQDIKSPMCCRFNNWLNVFQVFWTFSLVWTFPHCAGIKSSADSCRWLNAHHISMFWPTKGDTKLLARDKGPRSHRQLGFSVSSHNADRSHLQRMIRDDYPQQCASLGCSPFKRAHRRRAVH